MPMLLQREFEAQNQKYGSLSIQSPVRSSEGVCLSRSHFVFPGDTTLDFDTKNTLHEPGGSTDMSDQSVGLAAKFSLILKITSTESTKLPEDKKYALTSHDLPRKLRILVVDDESSNRKLLVRKFLQLLPTVGDDEECFEWVIETASSGEQALKILLGNQDTPRTKFDLVTMDEHMSKVSILPSGLESQSRGKGTASIRELRKRGLTTNVLRIVSVSGSTRTVDTEEFKAAGADDVWPKPVPPSEDLVQYMLRLFPPPRVVTQESGSANQNDTDLVMCISPTYSDGQDSQRSVVPKLALNTADAAFRKIAEDSHPALSPSSSSVDLQNEFSTVMIQKNKRLSSANKNKPYMLDDDEYM